MSSGNGRQNASARANVPQESFSLPNLGLVLLAGGTGRRLGGASKPDLTLSGNRLVDLVLARCAETFPDSPVVVVAPESLDLPAGTLQTLESPPFGGPAAGVDTGWKFLLERFPALSLVGVLPVDAPRAPFALAALLAAASPLSSASGAMAATGEQLHPTLTLARIKALTAEYAGSDVRDMSLRKYWRPLDLPTYQVPEFFTEDIDTPQDLARQREVD
ncbi:hypothetical protein BK816_06945 [Boudabousia tangfeifanii]|uniref:MobA-like NTP transferase domain-containing protein n=2 Tax=Boudabousia tangfeifanii TaxID=1912795 RepID=A0A1D9ML88_9ACTO|nr:hypothetical protein BK816_06945 [Boudabousia tangfeifanii]